MTNPSRRRADIYSKLLRGAISGLSATIPMTVAMRAMHRALPPRNRHALPPEKITAAIARKAGAHAEPEAPGWEWKTYAGHFSYGAGMGCGYALTEPLLPGSPAVKGMLFGLGVWAGSYLGWLPLAKMPSAAKDEPTQRNALMIAAHLVWGAAEAELYDR